MVSSYLMVGIGQVVTLEIPACKLRGVNIALEKTAWLRMEFYPACDFKDGLGHPANRNP